MSGHETDPHAEAAKRWLSTDALQQVEEQTGKPYNNPEVTGLSFLMHYDVSDKRRAALSEIGDTYLNMPWTGFLETVAATSFEIAIQRTYTYPDKLSREVIVAGDRERKLLMIANSFAASPDRSIVNRVSLYGQVEGGATEASQGKAFEGLASLKASFGALGETQYQFSMDGREGLKLSLDQIDAADLEHIDWLPGNTPHLYFTPYEPRDGLTRTQIDAHELDVLLDLPDWLQVIINRTPEDHFYRDGYRPATNYSTPSA